MIEQEYHEMVVERVHSSGVEEWYCPTCGYRLLMQWPPAYKKVVLESGDVNAIHSGWNGGLNILSSAEVSDEGGLLSQEEQEALYPWIEWMERVNFAGLWDRTF